MARSRRPEATQTPSRERKTTTPRRLQATQIPTIRIRRPAHRLAELRRDIEKLKRELRRLNKGT